MSSERDPADRPDPDHRGLGENPAANDSTARPRRTDVGYGRPPREHQWKKGQSGNPKGRRKGSKNEATLWQENLQRKIPIRIGGRLQQITVLDAIVRRMIEDALKGNQKSAAFVLNRWIALQSSGPQQHELSEDDRAVLEAYIQSIQEAAAVEGGGAS